MSEKQMLTKDEGRKCGIEKAGFSRWRIGMRIAKHFLMREQLSTISCPLPHKTKQINKQAEISKYPIHKQNHSG